MMKARKNYPLPDTWAGIFETKVKMQIELLTRAQEGATDAGFAAKKIGMTRNMYVLTCRRLGVPIDHLLDRQHPRWSKGEAA